MVSVDGEGTEARTNDTRGMEPLAGDHRGYSSGGNIYVNTNTMIINSFLDSSGRAVVENPPANAGDPGSISAGRSSHVAGARKPTHHSQRALGVTTAEATSSRY